MNSSFVLYFPIVLPADETNHFEIVSYRIDSREKVIEADPIVQR